MTIDAQKKSYVTQIYKNYFAIYCVLTYLMKIVPVTSLVVPDSVRVVRVMYGRTQIHHPAIQIQGVSRTAAKSTKRAVQVVD
jgi:hypothetical protein